VAPWRAILPALLLATGAASADVVSPVADAVTVTIYHDDNLQTSDLLHPEKNPEIQDQGLALITETRQIDLPAGPSEIRFRGVASTMVPQTATIDGLPAGTIERNFDYDLLSPGSLLAKSVGETVHLIRTNPKTGRSTDVSAIVRTGPDGAMLEVDGKLEALRCSGLPERLVFDKTPDGLTDTPTLTVRTNAPVAGHYTVKLSYIATGLNWSADYVARVHADSHVLDLTGWLTLANFGSIGFARVPIAAVAGRLNTTGEDTPIHPQALALATHCWPTNVAWWTQSLFRQRAEDIQSVPLAVTTSDRSVETVIVTGSHAADARQLGDYKIYDLPEPTDMPAHETKQVEFLDLPFAPIYRYRATGGFNEGNPSTLVLRVMNTVAGGLGKPLPAGQVALSEPGPEGAPVFIGQAGVKDMPVGLPVELENGEIFTVPVSEAISSETRTGSGEALRVQRMMDFKIANNRPEAIAFELWQALDDGDTKILSETLPHVADRGAAIWRIALKPGEKVQLHVAVETHY
jgi:hypothetical protein